jgi:hypothetical protein
MLNLSIRLLNGQQINLSNVPQQCTLHDIKRVIAPKAGMSIRMIRFLKDGIQLPDDDTLFNRGIVEPAPVTHIINIYPRQGGYSPFPEWKPVSSLDPIIGGIIINGNPLPAAPLAPLFDGTLNRGKFWFPLNYINHTPGCDIPVAHHLLQQFYDNCIANPEQTIEEIGTAILLANGYGPDPRIPFWFVPVSPATIAHHTPVAADWGALWGLAPVAVWDLGAVAPAPVAAGLGLGGAPVRPIPGPGVDQSVLRPRGDWTCSICTENETENGNVIYTVPCGHKFHVQCITPWVEQHNICPNCRANITGYSNVSIHEHTLGKRKKTKKTKKTKKSKKTKKRSTPLKI